MNESIPRETGRVRLLAVLVLLAATTLVYSNSFDKAFVLDDLPTITRNQSIESFTDALRLDRAVLTTSNRPLVAVSLAVNYALGGREVFGYHLFNLGVHLAAAVTLFGLLRRLFLSPKMIDRYGAVATPLAFAAALIWAVHPIQTESVTYIIQRAESMAGLFFFLTVYGAVRGWEAPGRGGRTGWHAAAVVACLLGVGSKQILIAVPVVLLGIEWVFYRRHPGRALRGSPVFYAGIALCMAVLLAMSFHHLFRSESQSIIAYTAAGGNEQLAENRYHTPYEYARTQPLVILQYLRMAVWPTELVLFRHWPIASPAEALPAAILVLALVLGSLVGVVARQPEGVAGLWFFSIIAPSSSIYALNHLYFEHRVYTSMAAVWALVVVLGYEALRRAFPRGGDAREDWRVRAAGVALVAVVAGIFGVRSYWRNEDYTSRFAIYSDTIAKNPHNPLAQYNLGNAYLRRDEYRLAIGHYEAALEQKPRFSHAQANLGIALARMGHLDEGIRHVFTALKMGAGELQANTYYNLGVLLARRGRYADAVASLKKALELRSDYPVARRLLGVTRNLLADQEREAWLTRTRANPDNSTAWARLGHLLLGPRSLGRAETALRRAIELGAEGAEVYNDLGFALAQQGRSEEAIEAFEAALAIEPDLSTARENIQMLREHGEIVDEDTAADPAEAGDASEAPPQSLAPAL